jgi:NADH:ubiquinone oxidoreductase subunit E
MNLCKRRGGREVVEEDKTHKAGELKSEQWRGLEENECLGKCEIVEAYLQGQIHGQTREREVAALRSRNHGETSWNAQIP